MTKIIALALVATASIAANAYAQTPDSICRTVPQLELTSMSGPLDHNWAQYEGSAVLNRPSTANTGSAWVLARGSGYLRTDLVAGIRRYSMASRQNDSDRHLTAYAQVLAGASSGLTGVGTAWSKGGATIQPGIGATYGSNRWAVSVQVDYRYVAHGEVHGYTGTSKMNGARVVYGVTYRMRPRRFAADGGACLEPAAPAAEVKPQEPSNPLMEAAIGFNGPQYWTAEFPGIALSVAGNLVRRRLWGAAAVVESDASYVRLSRGIGARAFVRSSGLESGKFGATAFAQWLVGTVDGGRSGIIVSNGGRLSQPGVGFTIGTSNRSFLVQIDKQRVAGGIIHDEMRGDTASLNRTRVTIGFVQRFLNWPR